MDTFSDDILIDILVHLPFIDKIKSSRVCHAWKRVCQDLISRQDRLEVTRVSLGSLHGHHGKPSNCVQGCRVHTTSSKDVIAVHSEEHLLRIITLLHLQCPNITVVAVSGVEWHQSKEQLHIVIDFILRCYDQQLACFSVCDFGFDYKTSLPNLQHLSVSGMTIDAFQHLLVNSPKLSGLQIYEIDKSVFSQFPKGLKTLKMMSDQNGLENIFVSPASETLEVLSLRSHDGLDSGVFNMPRLRCINFHGRISGSVLRDFLRSLELSHDLRELDMYSALGSGEDITAGDCIRLFAAVPLLQRLRVGRPSMPGPIIQFLVSSCPLLKMVSFTDGILTDDSLAHLARLDQLEDLEIVYNQGVITERGITAVMNGNSSHKLRRLIVFKSKGNFVTDQVKEQLQAMKADKNYMLREVKLSCDSGAFRM